MHRAGICVCYPFTPFLTLAGYVARRSLRSVIMLIIGTSSAAPLHLSVTASLLCTPSRPHDSPICPTFASQHPDKAWDRPQAPLDIERMHSARALK